MRQVSHTGITQDDVIYVLVRWDILELPTTVFTDGNARTSGARQFSVAETAPDGIVDFDAARAVFWHGQTPERAELRRKKQAEVLVRDRVEPERIAGFAVRTDAAKGQVGTVGGERLILVTPEWYYPER